LCVGNPRINEVSESVVVEVTVDTFGVRNVGEEGWREDTDTMKFEERFSVAIVG
jgi:hypothetical protein